MRGNDEQQGAVFSYLNPEERIPADPSVAADSRHDGSGAEGVMGAFRGAVRAAGASVDSSGEAVAGAVAAGSVFPAQRAATDGADELQPVVPLVRGLESGRCSLGCDGVHEKPGADDARRSLRTLAGRGVGAG